MSQNQDAACFVRLFGGRCVLQCGAAPLVDSDSEDDDRSESTTMHPSDMETPRGGLRAGRVERFKMVCLDTARVEIHGEATKLMKETKAATILCKINSPTFRKQLEGFLKTKASDAFGLCTHHRLLTQPWQKGETQTTTPRTESDNMPDAMMCCYRTEFACTHEHSLLCEATFMKNGKLMYVEDVSSLGDEVTNTTNTEGESGEYLGRVFRNIYETAQPFEISIETKRPIPVVACTEFNTAKALHDELARRASYFKKDSKPKDDKQNPAVKQAPVSTSDDPPLTAALFGIRNGVENL